MRRLWEKEDNHIFGEFFLIVASVMIAQSIPVILPNLNPRISLSIGFVLIIVAVNLLRKY